MNAGLIVSFARTVAGQRRDLVTVSMSNEGPVSRERPASNEGAWRSDDSGDQQVGIDLEAANLEAENLETRVQQAQKLETLGTLAGGVAHDFNNLLQAILGNASLIREHPGLAADVQESLEQIEIACRRAGELNNLLLAYAGKGRFVLGAVDLSQLALEMSKLLAASLPRRPQLLGHFAPGLPSIEGDPTQLRQVLMNLVLNAAESLPESGGVIRLSTGQVDLTADDLAGLLLGHDLPPGTYTFCEVCDTGSGMTEEVRSRIFDPFFTTKQQGRGLGLAAVLGIVRGHQGSLQVDSEPGSGTVVRVLFPACREAPQGDITAPHQQPAVKASAGTILVVDDEQAIRNSARLLLESLGFAVLTAGDGLEALATFKAERAEISAVLLDLSMPRMSGVEFLRDLRQVRPDVPILVSSGHSEIESVQQIQDAGPIGFIQKPYRGNELRAKLYELLQRGEAGRRQ